MPLAGGLRRMFRLPETFRASFPGADSEGSRQSAEIFRQFKENIFGIFICFVREPFCKKGVCNESYWGRKVPINKFTSISENRGVQKYEKENQNPNNSDGCQFIGRRGACRDQTFLFK